MLPHHKLAVISAVVGAAVPLAAYGVAKVFASRGKKDQPPQVFKQISPYSWTPTQVCEWLLSKGVSKGTIKNFSLAGITGEELATLTQRHVMQLCASANDIRIILSAHTDLFGTHNADPKSSTTKTQNNRERSVHTFLDDANNMFDIIVAPLDDRVVDESQKRLQMASQMYDLLDLFRHLSSADQQAAMLPLARQLSTVVSRTAQTSRRPSVQQPLSISQPATPSAAGAGAGQSLSSKVQPLHSMLDSFLTLLNSPEILSISEEELVNLSERISSQIENVDTIAQRLPPPYGDALRAKCEQVFQILIGLRNTKASTVSPDALVARLKELFSEARDPATSNLPARERRSSVASMIHDTNEIVQMTNRLPSEQQARQVKMVAGQVLALLEQMKALAESEIDAESENTALTEQVRNISEALTQVLGVLKSPQLLNASPDVRAAVCEKLHGRISQLREQVDSLPPKERRAAMDVIEQVLRLLSSNLDLAAAEASQGRDEEEEREPEEEEEEERDELPGKAAEKGQGEETYNAEVEAELDNIVKEMETIFNFLESKEFEGALPNSKREIAGKLLERVSRAKVKVLELTNEANPLVTELIVPLEDMLENMAGAQGPSEQFLEIYATLKDIREILGSPSFKSAESSKQKTIIREILSQLQQISSTLGSLNPSERKAAEGLITPLNDFLSRFIHESSPAAPSTVSPAETIKRLQDVMALLQGEKFANATPEERRVLVKENVLKLRQLRKETETSLGTAASTIVPIIDRLLFQLQQLSPVTEEEDEGEELVEEKEGARERQGGAAITGLELSGDEREQLFEQISQITRELKNGNTRGLALGKEDLRPLSQLHATAAALSNLGPKERAVCRAFEEELRNAHVLCANEEAGAVTEDDTSERMAVFINDFTTILRDLSKSKVTTLDSLIPFMSNAESKLKEADDTGLPWRENRQAMMVVGAVLGAIQKAQAAASQNSDSVSAIQQLLKAATNKIRANPPKSSADLTEYFTLLKRVQSLESQFTRSDLLVFKEFQEAVLEATQSLRTAGGDTAKEDNIADTLLAISDHLRDTSIPDELLNEYEMIINQLSNATKGATYEDAIASIREQIHLQRISNRANAGDVHVEDDSDNSDTRAAQGEGLKKEEEDAAAARAAANQEVQVNDKCVPDGLANEITLLPKIEARINEPAERFVTISTLFDIQNISKVLLHLTSSEKYNSDVEFKKRVNAAKSKFLSQLAAFKESESQSSDAQPSLTLAVTGEDAVDSERQETRTLTVFTDAESEQHPINEEFMKHLQQDENATSATTVDKETVDSWVGKSVAFIVSAHPLDGTDTSLSELILLHEILTKRYKFKVFVIIDRKLTAATLLEQIQQKTVDAKRLLVFYHVPAEASTVAVPHAAVFHDSSVLEHRSLLSKVGSCSRAVVIQSLPHKMEVSGKLGDQLSPLMAVELTHSAAREVEKVRCWLYKSIFTPLVVELLCRDSSTLLCPEDVMNYAITAGTRLNIKFGSFTNNNSASMGFFVPFDGEIKV